MSTRFSWLCRGKLELAWRTCGLSFLEAHNHIRHKVQHLRVVA